MTLENFSDFHNTEKKKQERLAMLQGQWPTESCGYCREIEDSGGFSDRMLHLTIPDQVPPELAQDPLAISVSPTILEVFFNNTCNLTCLYCSPDLSSRIHQENSKFGDFVVKGVSLKPASKSDDTELLLGKFWSWMEEHSHTLERFNVLGGEPFYTLEFQTLLDFFQRRPHPNLELGIVTNLVIPEKKLEIFIQKFRSLLAKKHLKRIDITCSIDCWGPEQEYVRYGIDLDRWQKNFSTLLKHRWLTININQTISVLTIKSVPDLLERLIIWRQQRPIGHFFSAVTPAPVYLMPDILGGQVFERDFEKILSLMPQDSNQDRLAISYMQGIRNHVASSRPKKAAIIDLKLFLDEKDRRRNTNWRQIFPWLIDEIDNVV